MSSWPATSPSRADRGPSSAAPRSRSRSWPSSPNPSSRSTDSPTSTGCSRLGRSGRRSTGSAATTSPTCWRSTPTSTTAWPRPRPSSPRWSRRPATGPGRPTSCGSGSPRSRRSAPSRARTTTLAGEESRLGFADTLRTAAEQAREALSSDGEQPDALATTSAARTLLESVREHDTEAAELADRLAEISYLLSDVAADVASYASRVESDPVRLAAVSERRAALTALTRKYGETVDEVLAWAESSATRLTDLDHTDDRIEELRAERDDLRSRLGDLAGALSAARTEAATRLAGEVTAELELLAMPHARIEVAVRQQELPEDAEPPGLRVGDRVLRFTSTGVDDVELLLAANVGSEPRPLAKVASGGELSRVMLALEVSLAATSPVPTFVFDEVDAGVGGKAAGEVGRRLARLARSAQVLVVTHLPQVAAYADHHVVVVKSSDGSVTTSGLTALDAGRA